MKIFLLLFFCSMSVLSAIAQTGPVLKGAVSDSSSNDQLENAVISVLNAKDSTLKIFTRATKDGSFLFDKLPAGSYLLLISYPGYADYVESFSLDSVKTTHYFDTINMTPRAKLLEGVIVDDQTTFKVLYNGSTSQPSFNQIQPFRQNTDPLNIYTGNPALKPSFTNRIGSWYQAYRYLTQRGLAFTPSLKGTSIKEGEMMEKLRSIFGKDPFFWGEAVKAYLL